jgi:REP element-mobilizing transposase RayT
MSRSDRPPFLPGQYYHFYNRGARQFSIFREHDNYLFVLHKVKKYCREYEITPIAYCLMPNHYHFLLRQDGDSPARYVPQYTFNSYTKAYNKLYGHSGTLFEGHYRVKQIQSNTHLLHLCRYIHCNPVKDGFISHPADWPYSNYLEWIGARDGTLFDLDFVLEHFPNPGEYKTFVLDYLESRFVPPDVRVYLQELGKN